jgi:hypothetical protein
MGFRRVALVPEVVTPNMEQQIRTLQSTYMVHFGFNTTVSSSTPTIYGLQNSYHTLLLLSAFFYPVVFVLSLYTAWI